MLNVPFIAYCVTCDGETLFRFLDCEECEIKKVPCEVVICTECGDEIDKEILRLRFRKAMRELKEAM